MSILPLVVTVEGCTISLSPLMRCCGGLDAKSELVSCKPSSVLLQLNFETRPAVDSSPHVTLALAGAAASAAACCGVTMQCCFPRLPRLWPAAAAGIMEPT